MLAGSKTGSQHFWERDGLRKAREEQRGKGWLWARKTEVLQLFLWIVEKVPFEGQKGSWPQPWCSIFPLFIYCVILNCLHSSCPTATCAQRAWSSTTRAAKAEKEETQTPWKSGSGLALSLIPQANIFLQRRHRTWQRRPPLCFPPLRLLSKQPMAFSSDFNLQIASKHCRKWHGNFF